MSLDPGKLRAILVELRLSGAAGRLEFAAQAEGYGVSDFSFTRLALASCAVQMAAEAWFAVRNPLVRVAVGSDPAVGSGLAVLLEVRDRMSGRILRPQVRFTDLPQHVASALEAELHRAIRMCWGAEVLPG